MKKVITCIVILAFTAGMYAQELDSLKTIMNQQESPDPVQGDDVPYSPVIVDDNGEEVNVKIMDKDMVKVVEAGDSTYVSVGNRGVIQVIENPDSTRIRVGDKEISIVERNGDTQIHLDDVDRPDRIRNPKFRGHWAGFEWGINNFMDEQFTLSREDEDAYMDLNTDRSWAINLNFAQYSLGFGTSHFGAVIGMGLEYNNYFFDNNFSIMEQDDMVMADTLTGNVQKSKLATCFLRIPLIFEVQFPGTSRSKRVYVSAGIITGLKLGSHTKVVYDDEGGKTKDKDQDDFNINPFRFGVTTRIGFGGVSLFGDYYFTPMFVDGKGPELHPITVGLAFAF